MALPSVKINLRDGALGRVASTADGIAAMCLTGAAAGSLVLDTPYQLFSLKDAVALGLAEATNPYAYKQVEEFYAQAGDGATLWLELKDTATALDAMVTDKLLVAADGKIALYTLGKEGLAADAGGGMSATVDAARIAIQVLAETFQAKHQPFIGMIGGGDFSSFTALNDFSTNTTKNVFVLNSTNEVGTKDAMVGFTLGMLSTLPVQRSLARVKNGELLISEAGLCNGLSVDGQSDKFEALHAKHYLFVRTFPNRSGYYFSDDLNTASASSDFSSIARVRVINKIIRILDAVYTEELSDEVLIDGETGFLQAGVSTRYEQLGENAVNILMGQPNREEISGIELFVDASQNVLATDEIYIRAKVTPVGYAKTFTIDLSYNNPQNA